MNNLSTALNRSGLAIFIAISGVTHIAQAENKDCWATFYEDSQYTGKNFQIAGPARLDNLNNINGENWDKRIHSLKVGPQAKVIVYQNPNLQLSSTAMAKSPEQMQALGINEQDIKEDSELIFMENSNIHDLGDFAFHKKIRSLKVECN